MPKTCFLTAAHSSTSRSPCVRAFKPAHLSAALGADYFDFQLHLQFILVPVPLTGNYVCSIEDKVNVQ